MPEAMKFASMNPVEMVDAVGFDDFRARVKRARLIPWGYPGRDDLDIQLAAVVDFEIMPPRSEEKPFHQEIYTAGEIKNFAPGVPGFDEDRNPCAFLVQGDLTRSWVDMDEKEKLMVEGTLPVRVGRLSSLSKSCKWYELGGSFRECGFPDDNIGPEVTWIEGAVGDFLRVEGIDRKFKGQEHTGPKMILKMVDFIKYDPDDLNREVAKPADSNIEEKVVSLLEEAVQKAPMKLGDVAALMVSKVKGKREKSKAVQLITPEFLGRDGHPWKFDSRSGKCTAVEF